MICNICKRDLPSTEFYTYFHIRRQKQYTRKQCNICFQERANKKKRENMQEEYMNRLKELNLEHIDGRYDMLPGVYTSEEQKEMVHIFMTILNWKYDKKTNSWYKPGLKEIDGTWCCLKKRRYKVTKKTIRYTEETKKEIVPQLLQLKDRMSWKELEEKFQINDTTLFRWWHENK